MDDRFLYVGVAHEGIKEAPNWGVRHSYKLYKDRKNQSWSCQQQVNGDSGKNVVVLRGDQSMIFVTRG